MLLMRKSGILFLTLSLIFLGGSSCLLDPVETPPASSTTAEGAATTSPPTITTAPLSTTTAPPTTTTTLPPETTTTTAPPTPTTFPTEVILNYLKRVLTAEVGVSDLVEEISGISNDWDNRSETDVTYTDTEAAMEAAVERMQTAQADFELIQPPPTDSFPEKHLTVVSAVGQVAGAATEMLNGLQSADTGEQRQAAQVGLVAAFGVFVEGIDELIAEFIGDAEITALIVSRSLTVTAPAGSDGSARTEPTTTTTTTEPSN